MRFKPGVDRGTLTPCTSCAPDAGECAAGLECGSLDLVGCFTSPVCVRFSSLECRDGGLVWERTRCPPTFICEPTH